MAKAKRKILKQGQKLNLINRIKALRAKAVEKDYLRFEISDLRKSKSKNRGTK